MWAYGRHCDSPALLVVGPVCAFPLTVPFLPFPCLEEHNASPQRPMSKFRTNRSTTEALWHARDWGSVCGVGGGACVGWGMADEGGGGGVDMQPPVASPPVQCPRGSRSSCPRHGSLRCKSSWSCSACRRAPPPAPPTTSPFYSVDFLEPSLHAATGEMPPAVGGIYLPLIFYVRGICPRN